MKITGISRAERAFNIVWEDGSASTAPFIWLRDNDPHELHPHTHERTFDLLSVTLEIEPKSYQANTEELSVEWPQKESPSIYSAGWLYRHRPGHPRPDPARISKQNWLDANLSELPRFCGPTCEGSKPELLAALTTLKQTGIVLIDNLADDPMAGEAFGDLIGFKRETNYGVMFEVKSKPDPNNLAYTSLELPLHTDLANQEFIPGNQFLHCYRNSAQGGASRFADALSIVNEFQHEQPEFYQLLCQVQVPWRFIDEATDLRQHRPVINLDGDGRFRGLTFNAHIADVPDFEPELMYDFYAAFRDLMQRVRNSPQNIETTLQPGEMVVFDNQRILHGRARFDPNSGERHLRGYYVEHNEIENRIRILSK